MPDDLRLLEILRSAKPEEGLTALFEQYADQVYRLGLSLLSDPLEAEDVVQDTFIAVMTHIHQFEGRSKLSTWMYRIAYNFAQERLRRKPHEPLPEEEPEDDNSAKIALPQAFIDWTWTPDEILADQEASQMLEKAIQSLPLSLRVVFSLRDIQDLSTEETAEVLHISPGAVKVRLHRARMHLRETLSQYFLERA